MILQIKKFLCFYPDSYRDPIFWVYNAKNKHFRDMGQTFSIETFGCPTNKSDTEIMVGILKRHGFELVGDPLKARFIIVNTCAVKAPTEQRVLKRIRELSRLKAKLIIAGCLPPLSLGRIREAAPNFAAVLDPRSIDRIAVLMKEVMLGKRNLVISSDRVPRKPRLPRHIFGEVRGIIQIAEGCAGSCSYCCVRYARGPLKSFEKDDLLEEAKMMLQSGCRELWVTSQDNAAYGADIGSKLPSLLSEICQFPYQFRVRVGMMNPRNVLPIEDDLIEAYEHPKVYKFLHLPLQSGDDEILSAMRRGYSVEQFVSIVEHFREAFPRMTLSTDVITGFPGETESQFRHSLELINQIKPDIVNISRFGLRPGTPAASYPSQLHGRGKKRRSRKISELVQSIGLEINRRWIGWSGKALIAEVGAKGGWIARNISYKPIVIHDDENLLGSFVEVRVTSATSTYLIGNLVS